MSASVSTILPYRTRSRMIVSYDEDFGKVDWAHFKTSSEPVYEDSEFGKVNWSEVEKERMSNEVLNKAITLVARETVERVVVNAMLFSQQTEERISPKLKQAEKQWPIPADGFAHPWVHNGVKYAADGDRGVWTITADEGLEWVGIYNLETGVIDAVPEPIWCD